MLATNPRYYLGRVPRLFVHRSRMLPLARVGLYAISFAAGLAKGCRFHPSRAW